MGLCLGRAWEGCLSCLQVCSCSQVSAGDLDETAECNFSSFSWVVPLCGVEEQSLLHVPLAGATGRHCPAAGKGFPCSNDTLSPMSLSRAEVKPSVQENSILRECEIWQRPGVRTARQNRVQQPPVCFPRSGRRGPAPETCPVLGVRGAAQPSESSGELKLAQACGKVLPGKE